MRYDKRSAPKKSTDKHSKSRHKKNTAKPDFKTSLFQKISFGLLGLSTAFMIWSAIHLAMIGIFPIGYIIVLLVLMLSLVAIQVFLILKKSSKIVLKLLSIAMSYVIVFTSMYCINISGNIDNFIEGLSSSGEHLENENAVKNITNTPFTVYLSGLDTRDLSSIYSKGLSDVNMVFTVNPKTKQILIVNVPRDYYVGLWGDNNKRDKLTHAGTYGVDCSMETLGAVFDVEFNYYAKVNFKSVIDIVDALGGITVESDFNFTSAHSTNGRAYTFVKGTNYLSGEAALAFARERHSFSEGDRQRGINQQKIISAIIDKAVSPAMLDSDNLGNFLTAVTDNVVTNFSSDEISDVIKMQLGDMASWDIATYSVDGTTTSRTTYTYPSQSLSVMIPNDETVDIAIEKMQAVMRGKKVS